MDCSPPGCSVHGILQARILEWFAIPFSRGSSLPLDWTLVSRIVGRFFTVWVTGAHWWLIIDISEVKVLVAQSCPTLCNPTDCSLSGPFAHGIFQARILEWVHISLSREKKENWKWKLLSRVPLFVPHGPYSPWNSPGQNTGVCNHSLLQGIFPTQGSNPGLPHCRRILYQLSHQGSPRILE